MLWMGRLAVWLFMVVLVAAGVGAMSCDAAAQFQRSRLFQLQQVRQHQVQRQRQTVIQRQAQPQRSQVQRVQRQPERPAAREAVRRQEPKETVRRQERRQPTAHEPEQPVAKHIDRTPQADPKRAAPPQISRDHALPKPSGLSKPQVTQPKVNPPSTPTAAPLPAKPSSGTVPAMVTTTPSPSATGTTVTAPAGSAARGGTTPSLDTMRQHRLEALQKQRRDQQQQVTKPPVPAQTPTAPGVPVDAASAPLGAKPAGAAVPRLAPPVTAPVPHAGAGSRPVAASVGRPITLPNPRTGIAKPVALPIVTIGPQTAGSQTSTGGLRAASITNRRLTSASHAVWTQYPPPVLPGAKGSVSNATGPGTPGGAPGGPGSYPPGPYTGSGAPGGGGSGGYPRFRIDRTSFIFGFVVSALSGAAAAEIPYKACNCTMRLDREPGTDEVYVSYVSRSERTVEPDIVVYPSPGSTIVSPTGNPGGGGGGSGGGGGGGPVGGTTPVPPAAPARAAEIAPPKPEDKRPPGPDSAHATLGGIGGAAFEACLADQAPTRSPSDGGAAAVPTDENAPDASPAHFMLETGGHLATIRSIVFTASGKCLLSGGDDKVIRIWSLAQGRSDRVLRGEIDTGAKGTIRALALSPDGALLAAGGSMEIAEHGGHAIRLFDLRSGLLVDVLIGHTDEVRALAFSADGKRLVSGSLDNNAVLWDIETLSPLQVLSGHSGGVIAVGFSKDGERIVTASLDTTARLWRAGDGSQIATLQGHAAPLAALAVRAGDDAVFTTAQDGTIKQWSGRDGALARNVARVEFSPGALVLAPGAGTALVTCADRCRREFKQVIVDLGNGSVVQSYGGHDGFVHAAAASTDGKLATAGGTRHEIHIWTPGGNASAQVLKGLGTSVSATGFYGDSRTFAWSYTFASRSHLVRGPMELSFDLPADTAVNLGEPLPFDKDAESGFVHAVDRLGDLSISASGADGDSPGAGSRTGGGGGSGPRSGAVRLQRNAERLAVITPGDGVDRSFAYRTFGILPTGEHVIVGGDNGVLEAYDLAGQKAVTYIGHAGTVWTQTPSPDGRLLVSGGSDGTVRLWNLASGELIVSLFQASNGEWVIWTPQGYYTGSAGAGELIGWQVNRGPDKAADFVRAQQVRSHFNRPDIIARAIALATAKDAVAELAPEHVSPEEIFKQGVPPVVTTLDGDRETTGGRGVIIVGLKENPLSVEGIDVWVRDRKVTVKHVEIPASFKRQAGIDYTALEIPLFAGENDIRVAASNEVGSSDQTEKGLTIRITHNGEGALDKRGTLFVLAIGVDKYPGMGNRCSGAGGSCDLQYAGGDAAGFDTTSRAEMGRAHDHVESIVLVNGKGADREPTLANIKAALARVQKEATDNDTVAMFFAGHGVNRTGTFYFMPTDVRDNDSSGSADNALSWTEVQSVINQLGGRKLLFLDACHAGNSYYARLGEDARLSRFVAFAAATGAQFAEEAPEVGHGEFTYALMGGLKGQGAPQADVVLVYDFASYISKEVIKRTKGRQTPEFFPTPGEGNFAIVKRQ